MTYRKLAADLNYSEAQLRHLAKTLEADPYDIELAHRGQISTNELSRRASEARKRRAAENSEAAQRRDAQMGSAGARKILKWLASDPAKAGNEQQIISEARFQSQLAEQTGGLPPHTLPIHLSQAEVIACSAAPGR